MHGSVSSLSFTVRMSAETESLHTEHTYIQHRSGRKQKPTAFNHSSLCSRTQDYTFGAKLKDVLMGASPFQRRTNGLANFRSLRSRSEWSGVDGFNLMYLNKSLCARGIRRGSRTTLERGRRRRRRRCVLSLLFVCVCLVRLHARWDCDTVTSCASGVRACCERRRATGDADQRTVKASTMPHRHTDAKADGADQTR